VGDDPDAAERRRMAQELARLRTSSSSELMQALSLVKKREGRFKNPQKFLAIRLGPEPNARLGLGGGLDRIAGGHEAATRPRRLSLRRPARDGHHGCRLCEQVDCQRIILSAMHQRQAVVLSALVCGSTEPVPRPVPKPVAKMAAQGVLRTARRLMRTKPLRRPVTPIYALSWKRCGTGHFAKSRWS
jgi:hypothetical protein